MESEDKYVVDDPEEDDLEAKQGTSKQKSTRGRGRGRGRPVKKKNDEDVDGNKTAAKKQVVRASKTSAKSKAKPRDSDEEVEDEENSMESDSEDENASTGELGTGAFLILKTDFDENKKDAPIWRIDGITLLEKFLPEMQDGKQLYKNTASFAPWNVTRKDNYYPAPVLFKQLSGHNRYVEFQRELVKNE